MKKILFALLLTLSAMGAWAQRPPVNPKLVELTSEKDSVALQQKLAALYASPDEAELILLNNYYMSKRNRQKAEEVSKLILEKHPNGLTAYGQLFDAIYNERDPGESEKKYRELMRRWPTPPAGLRGLGADGARYFVAVAFIGKKNPAKVMEYLNMIQDTTYKTNAFSYAARESLDAKDYAMGEQLIKKTMADVAKRGGAKPAGYNEYLRIYSLLLYHNGKYQEGFKYADELTKAPERYELSKKNYQTIYMNYLIALDRLKEAYPLMEERLREGAGNAEMKAKFKQAYIAAQGSDNGYDELMVTVNATLKEKIKSDLAKKAKNEPAYNFVAKDLSGKMVELSDYKGKVVVLDFWATWCGPCKASFPMMQKAVNKYKDDKDVVFLFIHSMETTKDAPKAAAAYIKDMKYTFKVLMDMKDPKTNINPAAAGYKVPGIPQKFVIDKTGNIRFSSLGGGNAGEDAFLEEMSAMIEIAKG